MPSWQFYLMIKTQVQIPDDLFKRARQVAAEREWSFAEVVRRGLEHMTRVHPPHRQRSEQWKLPKPAALGQPLASEDQWTALSHGD